MVKVEYDKQARILGFRLSRKRSVDSEVEDNVVIDRDGNGKIVNIEIMDVELGEFKKAKSRIDRIAHSDVTTVR